MFKRGDIVEILSEFQDPGDNTFTWMVMHDEEKGRVDIIPTNIKLKIKPTYTLKTNQIKLVEIAGLRIAGLGGVFRGKVWTPPAPATFENPKQYLARCGKGNFWRDGLPLTHRSTIFPVDYERLQKQRADILVTHEAPSSHPHGFAAIDELARRLGVRKTFHGHHHDQLDYSLERASLGFDAFGVGFRGIIDQDGQTKTENVIWKSLFRTSPE